MQIKVKKIDNSAKLPEYATPGSSGFDFASLTEVHIAPGETKLIKTGLSMAIPEGFELQIRPRSGLSLKTSLRISNSPGTVDSDFTNEICIIMTNIADHGNVTIINAGDRIAQGVICPVIQATFQEVDKLDITQRTGGFGSTGV